MNSDQTPHRCEEWARPLIRIERGGWRHFTGICAAAFPLVVANVASAAPRPFTVNDSIELTEIVDPAPAYQPSVRHESKVSPDGRRFVIVLRRGHLDVDEVEYELILFQAADVLANVNARQPTALPKRDIVLAFRTSSGKNAIEKVSWRDNERLAFIARQGEERGQVYSFDLRTRLLQQLTDEPEGVLDFDIAADALIYAAPVFPDWKDRNRRGYVVEATPLENLTITDPKDAQINDVAFFVKDFISGSTSRLKVGLNWIPAAIGAIPLPEEIAISPNGQWGIVLATALKPPAAWAEYTFIHEALSHLPTLPGVAPRNPQAALESLVPSTALVLRDQTMKQFYVVDIAHASARPLLDAPGTGWGTHIAWSPDSARVALAPTFLPLDVRDAGERARRRSAPAMVVVDIRSGEAARITDRVDSISSLDWSRNGDIRAKYQSGEDGAGCTVAHFRKRGRQWAEVRAVRRATQRLELRVKQDMNTPPQIVATDHYTGEEGVITDLNPQLGTITLGRVEAFDWRDRFNRPYRGGLVFPPNFRSGQRYPVVLQTYGFTPNEFLVDGPGGMSTAYAARSIANKDIIVLQMPLGSLKESAPAPDATWRFDRDGENPRFVAMMEGAIDALSKSGLVDRSRVGLIGFSREGMHVLYAISFSKFPIAAATIAHSVQPTPFNYVLGYGRPYPAGTLGFEDQDRMGAPFWGDGIKRWMQRSPAFHLDSIKTPLRFEHLGTNVPESWDTFVILKRQMRPVEMVHIPFAGHQLERPLARYTSQQGNVDWFAFWLKGEVDLAPSKAAQYERWRVLREEHEALVVNPAH